MINITQKEIIKKINDIKTLKHIFIIDTDNDFTYDMFNNNENIFIAGGFCHHFFIQLL